LSDLNIKDTEFQLNMPVFKYEVESKIAALADEEAIPRNRRKYYCL